MDSGKHQRTTGQKWRQAVTGLTLVILVVLVYTLRREIGDVVNNLGKVNTWALLLMIPLQLLNYDAYARLYTELFRLLKENIRYKDMFKLTFELTLVNHILPSAGVSGISYFSLRMKSLGVSSAKSTLLQVMKFVLIFTSFELLLIIGLLFLSVKGHTNNFIILVAGSLSTLLIVFTVIALFVAESKSRIRDFLTIVTKLLNNIVRLFRSKNTDLFDISRARQTFEELHDNYATLKRNWRELKKPFLYSFIANATEVLTVYVVFIAFGSYVNLGAVILAYAVANFAGLLSVLPGGIGVYEALMTGVLAATGIKPQLSIPVIVMYRVLSILIQLPPGYYFYHKALNSGKMFSNGQ